MSRKRSVANRFDAFKVFNVVVLSLVAVATVYPFLNVLAISLNASSDTVKGGITVYPRVFTLKNYETVMAFGNIPHSTLISVLRTLIGTALGLMACSMVAYVLSRKDFMARKFFSRMLAITLYVSGGLVPFFLLVRDLRLMNNFLVYVIPGMVNAYYIFLLRSYMDGLPFELQESAKIDGANDFRIFLQIVLPVCKPVLATIALFLAVSQWNSWFDTYLYCGSKPSLSTLQFELMKIIQTTQSNSDAAHGNDLVMRMSQVAPESIKMAITIITVTPVMVIYIPLQRYFVQGMTIGSVKG
jgi:putative aldouronate transport system permease protein